jgi:hypothetical protein
VIITLSYRYSKNARCRRRGHFRGDERLPILVRSRENIHGAHGIDHRLSFISSEHLENLGVFFKFLRAIEISTFIHSFVATNLCFPSSESRFMQQIFSYIL